MVLAHPGGPCSSIPRGGVKPNRSYAARLVRGHSMACRNAVLAPPGSPATSFHFVAGGAVKAASRKADAPTSDIARVHKSNCEFDTALIASRLRQARASCT